MSNHTFIIKKIKTNYKLILTVLAFIAFSVLLLTYVQNQKNYINSPEGTCLGGVKNNHCSSNQPLMCINGTLVNKASLCGCYSGYNADGDKCKVIKYCSDKTEYGQCSNNPPLYCDNGKLIENVNKCGCKIDEIIQNNTCILKYEINPEIRQLFYQFEGNRYTFNLTVYKGLKDHLATMSRNYLCDNNICPSHEELHEYFTNNQTNQRQQKDYIQSLVNAIKFQTNNEEKQVRIAISVVQNIPYDYEEYKAKANYNRYPYEVLYDNLGVCGEKSALLALLLKELGYGVAYLDYPEQQHRTIGIKCPIEYSIANSEYCFVEASNPAIITDSYGEYTKVGKLSSNPEIIPIADGKALTNLTEDYQDALKLKEIYDLNRTTLYRDEFAKWRYLANKYGLDK